jgi:hypothetical protein
MQHYPCVHPQCVRRACPEKRAHGNAQHLRQT